MRGFVFGLRTHYEDSCLFSRRLFQGPGRPPGGESCGPCCLHRGEASAGVCGKPNFVLSLDL
jgi:hypothetical protein